MEGIRALPFFNLNRSEETKVSDLTFTIEIEQVKYDDTTRQRTVNSGKSARKELDIESLAESIRRRGQLNAIIIDEENNLITGRRRLEACRSLGHQRVLARRLSGLSVADKRIVELDENIRRLDLTWQQGALALAELHALKSATEGCWDQSSTAEYAGLSEAQISKSLLAAKFLQKGDEKVRLATNLAQAYDLIRRRQALILETAMSKGFEDAFADSNGGSDGTTGPSDGERDDEGPTTRREDLPDYLPRATLLLPTKAAPYRINHADFLTWLPTIEYPRFNLIHCDFPYGINFQNSGQAGSAHHDTQYDDSEELFWELTNGLLQSQDRIVLSSAHMIFWFSMKYYTRLVETLEAYRWFVVPHPLIWHKSDGAGIASDYRRRPKHIYETALFCSRGDRQISTLRNDVYSSPIAKAQEGHLSAKPVEMLQHFLSMVCGPESDMLDPTCGSGTSIRAAALLGANSALGLEINRDTAEAAQHKLRVQQGKGELP